MWRRWPVEIDGRQVDKLPAEGTLCVPVAAGLHVVRVGGKPSGGLELELEESAFVEVEARGREGDGMGRTRPVLAVVRTGPIQGRRQ